jgi:hypothetical protein
MSFVFNESTLNYKVNFTHHSRPLKSVKPIGKYLGLKLFRRFHIGFVATQQTKTFPGFVHKRAARIIEQ